MFKAQPAMIKEQIEVLIQRGYMERDPKNKKMLIYLPWTIDVQSFYALEIPELRAFI